MANLGKISHAKLRMVALTKREFPVGIKCSYVNGVHIKSDCRSNRITSVRVNPDFTLKDQVIIDLGHVYYNLIEPILIEEALTRKEGELGKGGAVLVSTGKFTGRSPKNKHVVKSTSIDDKI